MQGNALSKIEQSSLIILHRESSDLLDRFALHGLPYSILDVGKKDVSGFKNISIVPAFSFLQTLFKIRIVI